MPQVPTQLGHLARHQAQDAHTLGQLASTELRTFQQALDALRLGPDLRLQQACLCRLQPWQACEQGAQRARIEPHAR